MKRIVINGANGYVASHFIFELLKHDYEVIALVRESKNTSPQERMQNVLSEINDGELVKTSKLKVYNYALLSENFGMSEDVLKDIFSKEVDYYHFAASLKFDFKSREEIFNTNINGLENSINVYLNNAIYKSRFFFISTAYSCGKFNGTFKEQFYANEDIESFRNYYEQSKRFAENVIKNYMDSHRLNAHIIRLSQVIGNSQNGVTLTDYGIFDFTKRVLSLGSRHPNNKVRIIVDSEATQNLIPIDTITGYLMHTVKQTEVPTIMNFVAKKSTKNAHILEALNQMTPLNITADSSLKQSEMTSLERIISIGMSFTSSYTATNISFCTEALDSMIEQEGNEVDKESLFRMLRYFIDEIERKKGALQSKAG